MALFKNLQLMNLQIVKLPKRILKYVLFAYCSHVITYRLTTIFPFNIYLASVSAIYWKSKLHQLFPGRIDFLDIEEKTIGGSNHTLGRRGGVLREPMIFLAPTERREKKMLWLCLKRTNILLFFNRIKYHDTLIPL